MTITETRAKAAESVKSALDHVPDLAASARSGAEQVVEHMPEAIDRARAGAQATTTTLQTMPDQTLKLLAAGSVGLDSARRSLLRGRRGRSPSTRPTRTRMTRSCRPS